MTATKLRNGQAELPTPQSTESYWHREPSKLLYGHRTTSQLPQQADVVIVGSGIAGSFAARELVSQGRSVLMLEAREACWGATGRNGGHCQPMIYARKPHIARFELDTYNFLRDLVAKHAVPCDWRTVGGVHCLRTKEEVDVVTEALKLLKQHDPELATKATLHTHHDDLESLRVPEAAGAVVQPNAAKLWPYKLVAWVLEQLVRYEGLDKFNLQTNTAATHIQKAKGSWIVHTSRGQVATEQVLLTTNAYTSHLLPKFTQLITPVRGQVCALEPPRDSAALKHSYVWIAHGNDSYLIQRDESELIILGGERCSVPGGQEGISRDDEVNKEVGHQLRLGCHAVGLKLRPSESEEKEELKAAYEWSGIMGYSADGNPWVGRVPETLGGGEGLWLCAGFTGHGMPLAARCAIAAAEQIAGGEHLTVDLPREFEISDKRVDHANSKSSHEQGGLVNELTEFLAEWKAEVEAAAAAS